MERERKKRKKGEEKRKKGKSIISENTCFKKNMHFQFICC